MAGRCAARIAGHRFTTPASTARLQRPQIPCDTGPVPRRNFFPHHAHIDGMCKVSTPIRVSPIGEYPRSSSRLVAALTPVRHSLRRSMVPHAQRVYF